MCFPHIHLSNMLKLLTSSYNLETILQYPTCDKSEYFHVINQSIFFKAGRKGVSVPSSCSCCGECSMDCSNCTVQFTVFIKSDKSQVNCINSI